MRIKNIIFVKYLVKVFAAFILIENLLQFQKGSKKYGAKSAALGMLSNCLSMNK